jgi:staphylococcal nuclease domain-containing protein 1
MPPKTGKATVKAVLSGDTVLLMGASAGGPPPEMQMSLSSLAAPRLARREGDTEEAFAWQSREFLRKLCVGKVVEFAVEYSVAAINRDFGTLALGGKDLSQAVVAAGFATVSAKDADKCAGHAKLLELEAEAAAAKAGLHTDEEGAGARDVSWSCGNANELLAANKGKLLPCFVDYVKDGSSFRVITFEGEKQTVIDLMLTGVVCPKMNVGSRATAAAMPRTAGGAAWGGGAAAAGDGGGAAAAPPAAPVVAARPAPYAKEAKHFVELRVWHRHLDLQLEGVDKFGNFFGTLVHPAGNISTELVKQGLAQCAGSSSTFLPKEVAITYQAAELAAKKEQKRLWTGYTMGGGGASAAGEVSATVVEVVSGDTLCVMVSGQERRISLSSIRTPRLGGQYAADEPFAWQARESLRRLCIGATVRVSVEYKRTPQASDTSRSAPVERAFGTVLAQKGKDWVNLAEYLVLNGLADVVKHRADDARSAHYDKLLGAEISATGSKKGQHGSGDGSFRVMDLAGDGLKSRQYLAFLKRAGTTKAIITYVMAGSRFRAYVPAENCIVTFALEGVRCPQGPRPARPGFAATSGDKYGETAKQFTRLRLLQREVTICIKTMDKGGCAYGPCEITVGKKKVDFSLTLLQEGLAHCDWDCSFDTYHQAEADAKAAQKRIWEGHTDDAEDESKVVEESLEVTVAEIVNGGSFFVTEKKNLLAEVGEKMAAIAAEYGTDRGMAGAEYKRGALVAALFDDGSGKGWYRGKLVAVAKDKASATVKFIDYGNTSDMPCDQLRPLDPADGIIGAQAQECKLAYTKAPTLDQEYGTECAEALHDLTWGKELVARSVGRVDGMRAVILSDPAANEAAKEAAKKAEADKKTVPTAPDSINQQLIEHGLARLDKHAAGDEVEKWKPTQEAARKGRVGMWQYGDADSDDEEVEVRVGRYTAGR